MQLLVPYIIIQIYIFYCIALCMQNAIAVAKQNVKARFIVYEEIMKLVRRDVLRVCCAICIKYFIYLLFAVCAYSGAMNVLAAYNTHKASVTSDECERVFRKLLEFARHNAVFMTYFCFCIATPTQNPRDTHKLCRIMFAHFQMTSHHPSAFAPLFCTYTEHLCVCLPHTVIDVSPSRMTARPLLAAFEIL